jgi:hypothetical protein
VRGAPQARGPGMGGPGPPGLSLGPTHTESAGPHSVARERPRATPRARDMPVGPARGISHRQLRRQGAPGEGPECRPRAAGWAELQGSPPWAGPGLAYYSDYTQQPAKPELQPENSCQMQNGTGTAVREDRAHE